MLRLPKDSELPRVRASRRLRAKVERLADAEGRTVSDYLRRLVEHAVADAEQPAGRAA